MAGFGSRGRRLWSIGVLLGCMASVPALAQSGQDDADMARELNRLTAGVFVLDKALKLDPALRAQAEKMGAAHVARIGTLLPAWIQEERGVQGAGGKTVKAGDIYHAVWARLLNELAIWQVEPGDEAYERATLEALKASSLSCRTPGDTRFPDFSSRIMRMQTMPAPLRQAVLATERRLLEHWGQARTALPQWPDPLPQDAGMAAVARLRAGTEPPPLALSPLLASHLLAERETYQAQPWEIRCAFQHWWLQVSLAQGTPPAQALNAFRYGTLITAADRYGSLFDSQDGGAAKPAASASPGYPALAARFDATGVTKISRRFDAAGKPVQASVTERRITVRGIRGVRPVAFENTFDAPSLRYALEGGPAGKSGTPAPVFEMVWQLDGQGGKP